MRSSCLKLEFGSPPVTSLGFIPDGIASLHPNPLWNKTELFHLLSETGLDFHYFVSLYVGNVFQVERFCLVFFASVDIGEENVGNWLGSPKTSPEVV